MGATHPLYEGHAREGQVAQLVEQRTENPRVGGSIPPLATRYNKGPDGAFVVSATRINSRGSIDSDRLRPNLTLRAAALS